MDLENKGETHENKGETHVRASIHTYDSTDAGF